MSKTQEVLMKMSIEAANLAAKIASETLMEIGEKAADSFYKDYSPKQYGRSYGFYNASKPLIKTISGPGTAQGGIVISSSSIGGHYNQSPETVFEWDFIGGEHGGYNAGTPVSFPSPMDTIENDLNSSAGLIAKECKARAQATIQKQYAAELRQALINDLKSRGVK